MAKPYLDGKGWAVRMRIKGQDIYLSGFATEAAAKRAAAEKRQALASVGKPKRLGPWRTSVGQALQGYGRERLAHMKGGKHDAACINRYPCRARESPHPGGSPTRGLTKVSAG